MNAGGAASFLEGFASELASVGHTSLTISGYLSSAIHFGGWVQARGLHFVDIDDNTIKAFGTHHCECPGGHHHKQVSRAFTARVQRFAEYLRQQRAIRAITDSASETASPLSAFSDWLLRHRGLATITVERHELLITRMLPALGSNTADYSAASVRSVVLDHIRGCRPAHASKDNRWSTSRLFAIPGNERRLSTRSRPHDPNRGGVEALLSAPVPRSQSGSPACRVL
jgi:hypothetical protein